MKKYVFLGNKLEWWKPCLADCLDYENARLVNDFILLPRHSIRYYLARIHFSERINKVISLPLKKLWYRSFCKYLELNHADDFTIIIYDWNLMGRDECFLKFLKENYRNVNLVYVFTNIVAKSGALNYKFLKKLKRFFDIVFAFDPDDAKRYGFSYTPLVYSKKLVRNKRKVNDVFYVGRAKDRKNELLAVYERLKNLGLKTDFYIAETDDTQRFKEEIHYNELLTYEECIVKISKAECIVDVIQGNSAGLTIKVCEAIYHNKKLITTNQHLREYPFYDGRYMLIIQKPEDITLEFFENNKNVQYDQKGIDYFSLNSFFDRIDKELCLKQGELKLD